jgi:glucan 1,3-beta-glucosidase
LENIHLSNTPVAIEGGDNTTVLQGTPANSYISAWGEGHSYTPNGPNNFQGSIQPVSRPASLLQADGKYYERSKPQYEQYRVSDFISARSVGATGDGHTDDTKALQKAINLASAQRKILFVDHGDYLVSKTIHVPAGSRIVGEAYSVILSYGRFFNNINSPKPVVQIGKPGETGTVEWSDMIVSTQGQQRGAILFEYNIKSPAGTPTGVWDVHARIGGFAGSNLQLAQCPTTPNVTITAANLDYDCIAAFLTVHITKSAAGIYLENNWIWTADHDVEDPQLRQITVYTGRGLLDESRSGPVWLVGTAVEHHVKYEYQFVNTQDVFAGQVSAFQRSQFDQADDYCDRSKQRRHTINRTRAPLFHSHSLLDFTTRSSLRRLFRLMATLSRQLTVGVFELLTPTAFPFTAQDFIRSSTTILPIVRLKAMARSAKTESSVWRVTAVLSLFTMKTQ